MQHPVATKIINASFATAAVVSAEVSVVTFNMHKVPHEAAIPPLLIAIGCATVFGVRRFTAWHTERAKQKALAQYQRTLKSEEYRKRRAERQSLERQYDQELFARSHRFQQRFRQHR